MAIIDNFKRLPPQPGPNGQSTSPILMYFGTLLEKGELNQLGSLELARPVLAQGKTQLTETWLKANKVGNFDLLT